MLKTIRLSNFLFPALALLMLLMASGRVQASPVYALSVSSNANRSSAVALQGATFSGSVYVFTSSRREPSKFQPYGHQQSLLLARQFIHDRHCDTLRVSKQPYDFVDTVGDGTALPWGTSSVANGTHSITQLVTLSGGGTEVDSATFSVGTTTAMPSITTQPANQSVTTGQTASFK